MFIDDKNELEGILQELEEEYLRYEKEEEMQEEISNIAGRFQKDGLNEYNTAIYDSVRLFFVGAYAAEKILDNHKDEFEFKNAIVQKKYINNIAINKRRFLNAQEYNGFKEMYYSLNGYLKQIRKSSHIPIQALSAAYQTMGDALSYLGYLTDPGHEEGYVLESRGITTRMQAMIKKSFGVTINPFVMTIDNSIMEEHVSLWDEYDEKKEAYVWIDNFYLGYVTMKQLITEEPYNLTLKTSNLDVICEYIINLIEKDRKSFANQEFESVNIGNNSYEKPINQIKNFLKENSEDIGASAVLTTLLDAYDGMNVAVDKMKKQDF